MKKFKKKGFTLIELIAVLVIMAIIALIVTPLVMSIIRKARVSADKRSVDAYGRSIELAIAGYLLDTGKFPTEVSQLTIEYSGNKVECETTQINSDSSVYLAGCTVAGRSVENYTYGSDKSPTYTAYTVGDEVAYNNVDYYVIKDSSASEETVTLLKAEPLTMQEISDYKPAAAQTGTNNGYTGMQYHSSSSSYDGSYVKITVDAWKIANAPAAVEARLITLDDLTDSLGIELNQVGPTTIIYTASEDTPIWVFEEPYSYWTSSVSVDRDNEVWFIAYNGGSPYILSNSINNSGAVRPVIVLPKSALN